MHLAARAGRRRLSGDAGASAVEFALVLPILLLLLFGIVDFGRAYQAKTQLTHAVREGVRTYVVTQDGARGEEKAVAAAVSLGLTVDDVTTTGCSSTTDIGEDATLTATYSFDYLTPLPAIVATLPGAGGLAGPITLTESGVMRCGG